MASEVTRELVSISGGLRCRAKDCDEHFYPANDWDRAALLAAVEARDTHELAVHDYRHERVPDLETRWSIRSSKAIL